MHKKLATMETYMIGPVGVCWELLSLLHLLHFCANSGFKKCPLCKMAALVSKLF